MWSTWFYLSEVGIIAPAASATARAQFAGLTLAHGRAELVRAVYEGLAYAIRDCFAAMVERPQAVLLSGGGARSPFWSQLIADVLGLPVEIPDGSESGDTESVRHRIRPAAPALLPTPASWVVSLDRRGVAAGPGGPAGTSSRPGAAAALRCRLHPLRRASRRVAADDG